MIYKSMALIVMFVLLLGTNRSNAQDPCDCVDEIGTAVEAVMATIDCDLTGTWEAPNALMVHLAKLQNWCGAQEKPLKSKVPNIVEGMLETIQDAYEGESIIDPFTFEIVWIKVPAPECAWDELAALEDILMNGCPVVE